MTIGPVVETVPDVVEPYVGWRVWSVVETDEGPVLRSLNRTEWVPGEVLVAKCSGRTDGPFHQPPVLPGTAVTPQMQYGRRFNHCNKVPSDDATNHSGAGCGIYSTIDAAESVGQFFPRRNWQMSTDLDDDPYVLGRIEAFGRVVVSEKGYRSAKARLIAIAGTHPLAQQISERYVVPVEEVDVDAELAAYRERNPFACSVRRQGPTPVWTMTTPAAAAASALQKSWSEIARVVTSTPLTLVGDFVTSLTEQAAKEAADRAARDAEKALARPFQRKYLDGFFGGVRFDDPKDNDIKFITEA